LEVTYELMPEDVWHYQLYYRRNKAVLRPVLVYLLLSLSVIVGLGGCFVAWLAWSHFGRIEWNIILPLAVMALGAFLVLPPTKARTLKMHRQKQGGFAQHTYRISPQWFSQTTPVSESKNAWTLLCSLEEDSDYLYYFQTRTIAFIIPKRAFTSHCEAQAFLNVSRRYWDAAKMGTPVVAEETAVWPPAPRPGG